ncbi:hypothetical protein FDECE_453 [Fusarium decemcellulare]|nr:hypothetical protein FDECE_453 [Fusarium decemcellulare]
MLFRVALPSLMAFVPVVLGKCYDSGAPFPDDHTNTIVAIQSAAYQFEHDSPLSPGEHVFDYKVDDKMLHFVLDNISGSLLRIGKSEAIDGFTKEYSGCKHGGDTSYTNWRYVLDPNEA